MIEKIFRTKTKLGIYWKCRCEERKYKQSKAQTHILYIFFLLRLWYSRHFILRSFSQSHSCLDIARYTNHTRERRDKWMLNMEEKKNKFRRNRRARRVIVRMSYIEYCATWHEVLQSQRLYSKDVFLEIFSVSFSLSYDLFFQVLLADIPFIFISTNIP